MKNISNYEKPKDETYERFWRNRFAELTDETQESSKLKAAKTLTSLSFSYLAFFLISAAESLLNSPFFKSIGNKRINTMLALFSVLLVASYVLMIIISGKKRVYGDSVLNSKKFSAQGVYGASVSVGVSIVLAILGIFMPRFFYASAAVSFVFIILQMYYFSRTVASFIAILTGTVAISFFPLILFFIRYIRLRPSHFLSAR